MRLRPVLSVVVGVAAVVVSGCAAHGGEASGAPAVTRPTKAPVRPTVAPEREFPMGHGEPALGGAPVE
ncbi:hypothetical protein LZG04_38145 [Saccharothrix sp. S26]|uniref:hypothetical protein n=1 Tax=Saccharothrix sp. S26 TaxID=2907215 RepID=UPI001F2F6810|nr:hypothetical protein [Saccharothrix sp. S26]MCE7000596.1 hypothetical protein [Saccharothrix sp. S26]